MSPTDHWQSSKASQLTVKTGVQDLHCFRSRCSVRIYIYKLEVKFICLLNVPIINRHRWMALLALKLAKSQKIPAGTYWLQDQMCCFVSTAWWGRVFPVCVGENRPARNKTQWLASMLDFDVLILPSNVGHRQQCETRHLFFYYLNLKCKS